MPRRRAGPKRRSRAALPGRPNAAPRGSDAPRPARARQKGLRDRAAHDPSCRLAFVLAEGLRHIGERRARTSERGTMRVLRPARQTDPMKQPPRTHTGRHGPIAS